ncbi:hypothetical protein GOODEAATRI_023491, partial [Goodea atripinnis]
FTGADGPSGFGFELTFRLKREEGETAPPTWPAELMQGLARYVFQSEELQAAQQWNGQGILELMRGIRIPVWVLSKLVLIIAYVCCTSKQERVDQGIETEGSNLSGVSAKCVWDDLSRPPDDEEDSRSICIGSQPRRLSNKGTASPKYNRSKSTEQM